MTRPILAVPVGFAPSAVDKVERLLEVLDAFRNDAYLRDAFVLHGGTALNLFYDDAPRLSVDIDLMYVVQATNNEHSGQTYRVKYPGDYVKVIAVLPTTLQSRLLRCCAPRTSSISTRCLIPWIGGYLP